MQVFGLYEEGFRYVEPLFFTPVVYRVVTSVLD